MTFLVGCEKNTTDKTLSTKQETSDEDVIASGNGTGGTGSSSSSKDKDITSFAYSDKKKAPDGTKIISDNSRKLPNCFCVIFRFFNCSSMVADGGIAINLSLQIIFMSSLQHWHNE